MTYKEVQGCLIKKALNGEFDVVAQGNNCFCVQGAGLAPQFVKAFGTDKFPMEDQKYAGDINKLGTIDYKELLVSKMSCYPADYNGIMTQELKYPLTVVNCYSQYNPGADGYYTALQLCMKKINYIFAGKHIGLPLIGCGIAGLEWGMVKKIIQHELKDCTVTIVKLPQIS